MLPNLTTIFTDGSSRGNPGPGGWGAVIVFPKNQSVELQGESAKYQIKEVGGGEEHTTNNRMELKAAIEALSFLEKVSVSGPIVINCDSSYVINGITKWVYGWQKNGWVTATKKEVENRDLWEALAGVSKGKNIEWKRVSGHVGVVGNERCDVIATEFADGNKPELYVGALEDYGVKNILSIEENAVASSAKSVSRSHSNAKAYSYVSFVDGKISVTKTWAECEAIVKGKKAKYKKVLTQEEEKELVDSWQKNNPF